VGQKIHGFRVFLGEPELSTTANCARLVFRYGVVMNTSTVSLISLDGNRFEIVPGRPNRIGRGNDNDLVIPDRSVSHHHAIIVVKDGRCIVRDLESANGTFLSGRQISDARLAAGDHVRFGEVEFTLDNPGARSAVTKSWWHSRLMAVSAAAAIGVITFVGLHQRESNRQTQSSGSVISPLSGSSFYLPGVSTDFVGNWSGALPVTFSSSPDFTPVASVDMGATFYVANGRVVIGVAAYAGPGTKLTKIAASGIDDKHVTLEEEIIEKDTLGQPLWERDRTEIALVSSSQLDCTETIEYFRNPNNAPVASVIYKGPLRRISEAERQREAREMERKGLKKQGETRTPVFKG